MIQTLMQKRWQVLVPPGFPTCDRAVIEEAGPPAPSQCGLWLSTLSQELSRPSIIFQPSSRSRPQSDDLPLQRGFTRTLPPGGIHQTGTSGAASALNTKRSYTIHFVNAAAARGYRSPPPASSRRAFVASSSPSAGEARPFSGAIAIPYGVPVLRVTFSFFR